MVLPYILDFVEGVDRGCGAGLLRHMLKSQSRAPLASEVQSSGKPWYSGVTVSICAQLSHVLPFAHSARKALQGGAMEEAISE